MKALRNILLTGTILFTSLTHNTKAQELFNTHFYNFNQEISEEMDNPSLLEDSNLILKAQEGYELDEYEQKKVRGFFQNKAESYMADKLIEFLKESGFRKYIEPIEKITKGFEVSVPRTRDKIKIKPDIELDSENNLQGELEVTYRNIGISARTDKELKARISFFEKDSKRLNIEAGYNDSPFLGFRFGIIY